MKMKLEEHINHLPKHSVGIDLWDNIGQQISPLTSLVDKLPHHKADPDLWYSIESQLGTTRRFFRLRNFSVAASIAVIVALGTVFISQNDQGNVYYTEDIYMHNTAVDNALFHEVDILENCNDYPAVCSTPDFTHLKSNLDQLKREELKLRDLKKSTNDPKMELYHSRIVKNIQQVEAQMIQMFS